MDRTLAFNIFIENHVWHTKENIEIPVEKLTSKHIFNILKYRFPIHHAKEIRKVKLLLLLELLSRTFQINY